MQQLIQLHRNNESQFDIRLIAAFAARFVGLCALAPYPLLEGDLFGRHFKELSSIAMSDLEGLMSGGVESDLYALVDDVAVSIHIEFKVSQCLE